MIFETESGSVYEMDRPRRRIRRLSGRDNPTPRQGPDGAWRTYADATPPTIRLPVAIVWADESVGPPAASGCAPGTLTSRVVRVRSAEA